MSTSWHNHTIYTRPDGSYVIRMHGHPYHVPPNMSEFAALWAEVNTWVQEHPSQVEPEPTLPPPSLETVKEIKLQEFNMAMAEIDLKLTRSTSDIVAAMLTPETLAETGEPSQATSELEQSKVIFAKLCTLQAQNRSLRAQILAAETVEAVQAISPVQPSQNALKLAGTQSLDSYLPNN